jgi:uncharacterized protein
MPDKSSPDGAFVSGLFSYPIKSCGGVSHTSAIVEVTGLVHDREWMLVDTRHTPARFMTQRDYPLLATVRVKVGEHGALHLTCDGGAPITATKPTDKQRLIRVKVWSSEVFGMRADDAAAVWFARLLGLSVDHLALVCFQRDHVRLCNTRYAGDSKAQTFFADGYPVLITNQSSLDDLKARLGQSRDNALPMNRFRPNIVVAGLEPWDEDHIDTITIGEVVLKLVKPCVRCEITTTNQTSGSRLSAEPLNTLARFRNNPDLGGVTFGWNAIVKSAGSLVLRDRAEIDYRF